MAHSSKRPTISVDQDTINNAVRSNSGHCMIADAIKRTIPNAKFVSVDLATMRYTDKATRERHIFLTPRKAQEALLDFDEGHPVEEFKFRMPAPAQVVPVRERDRTTGKLSSAVRSELATNHDGGNGVPIRRGGATPPRAALSNTGKTRRYGVQGLRGSK